MTRVVTRSPIRLGLALSLSLMISVCAGSAAAREFAREARPDQGLTLYDVALDAADAEALERNADAFAERLWRAFDARLAKDDAEDALAADRAVLVVTLPAAPSTALWDAAQDLVFRLTDLAQGARSTDPRIEIAFQTRADATAEHLHPRLVALSPRHQKMLKAAPRVLAQTAKLAEADGRGPLSDAALAAFAVETALAARDEDDAEAAWAFSLAIGFWVGEEMRRAADYEWMTAVFPDGDEDLALKIDFADGRYHATLPMAAAWKRILRGEAFAPAELVQELLADGRAYR